MRLFLNKTKCYDKNSVYSSIHKLRFNFLKSLSIVKLLLFFKTLIQILKNSCNIDLCGPDLARRPYVARPYCITIGRLIAYIAS